MLLCSFPVQQTTYRTGNHVYYWVWLRSDQVSEHDSLRQPPAAHSDERPCPQKSSRSQRRLNALTPGYLKGTVVRGHPMVWSLALCPDDAKQDPVVYGAEFGVVFLAKSSRMSVISRVGDFCVLRFYIFIYRYGSSHSVYSTLRRILAAVYHTLSFTCCIFY